ncbi:MAG: response regulator [Desulfobacterales bacterium]|nr:response regulator [Desulfobacterales bacterium]
MSVNILVVDDSIPMRSVIIRTIKSSGFGAASFVEANNGKEALDKMKDDWLDLVVTDYNMPEMDGMTLIQEMKKDSIFKEIPVLVVTTEGSQEKIEEFIEKGASGYIKKPFTPELIRQKLTEILGEMEEDEGFSDDSDDDLDF